jgi:TRAP-type C4-dicarboxylate transport system substrate-binding protein
VTALVVSAAAFDQLSDAQKAIVRDLAVENGRYASGLTISMGDAALADVAAAGVTVSEVDLAPFREAVMPVYEMLNLTAEADMVRQALGR